MAVFSTAATPAAAETQLQQFTDVAAGHSAYEAIEWAAETGVTKGYDDAFKPDQALSRRHALVFMERYFNEILKADKSEDFTRADMMILLKTRACADLWEVGVVEGSE